ncbi:MAG: carboxypeptidase [Candidatus Tectimicrobiota bacterium]|nr:MAG: carboxypeptidase [Candidatus Tectomicrobia bacterium]
MLLSAFDAMALVAGIRQWVELESPTTEPAAVNRLVDLVEAQLRALGLQVERIAGRDGLGDHLRARTPWGGPEAGILVLGHLDTVHPLGTLHSRLPFRLEGNRVYGPGIADMKGGAYLAYNALRYLVERGETTPLPVTLIYNSDEEVGSPTSRGLIEETARQAKYVLVTEPGRNGGCVVTARRGTGRFRLKITGRPAHSGVNHEQGRSALRELAHQILRLESMTDYARGITVNVGVAAGGTRANVVPAEAMAEVDLRVSTPEDAEAMVRTLLALQPVTPEVTLEVRGQLNRPPYTKTPAIDALYRHARALAAELGFALPETATGGGSDGNFTAVMGLPTLDGLGADGAGPHTYEEHIFLDRLVPRQALLVRLLQTLQ